MKLRRSTEAGALIHFRAREVEIHRSARQLCRGLKEKWACPLSDTTGDSPLGATSMSQLTRRSRTKTSWTKEEEIPRLSGRRWQQRTDTHPVLGSEPSGRRRAKRPSPRML